MYPPSDSSPVKKLQCKKIEKLRHKSMKSAIKKAI